MELTQGRFIFFLSALTPKHTLMQVSHLQELQPHPLAAPRSKSEATPHRKDKTPTTKLLQHCPTNYPVELKQLFKADAAKQCPLRQRRCPITHSAPNEFMHHHVNILLLLKLCADGDSFGSSSACHQTWLAAVILTRRCVTQGQKLYRESTMTT
eukprot:3902594-Amphidinium_carterae.2